MNQRLTWYDWLRSKPDTFWHAFGLAGLMCTLVSLLDDVSGDDPRHDFHEQLSVSVPD